MSLTLDQRPVDVPNVDLDRYATEAILPRMQYEERSSSGSTSRSPNDQRTLKSVHRISRDNFFDRVTSYFKARPPSTFSRTPRNWSLRVPHTSYPSISDAGVLLAEDEKGVQTWVEQVALQTALCLLHSAEPELLNLEFGHVWGPGTQGALSDVVFRMGSTHGGLTSKVNTLLVEVKCPWTLSLPAMHQISCIANGLPPATPTNTKNYDSARSVLAQVYDYCKEQGHCFWIITTYQYWVFGVFSADYDTALATEPISYNNASPTVLQCIMYWLQSSTFRAGAFEIPKMSEVMEFSAPSSRKLWVETLRRWRENGLQELGPKFAGAGYDNPDSLFAKCMESLERRNSSVDLASTWYGDTLQDSCRKVLRLLQTPSHNLQWTVVLTWLALLLEPASVSSELPCLEAAFKAACGKEVHRPNLLHWEGQGRSSHFRQAQAVDPTPPEIWSAGTTVTPVESLGELYSSHASHEVAFILDKYLPLPIQDQLKEMLVRLRLLGRASQEAQSEELGSDTSSQSEEASPEPEVITPSKRPSKPRRSDASATRASPGLLQDAITLWRTRAVSENAAGPSSASRAAAQPSTMAYSTYRSDSNSPGTPATPLARKAPNRPLFSPSSEWTPGSNASPDLPRSVAGKAEEEEEGGEGEEDEEEEGKIGSLMERLGGLAIVSPPAYESTARPRSTARSPLSTNNSEGGDMNLFFEHAQSLTIPARVVNDSPRKSPTDRSERSAGGAPSDGEGRVETAGGAPSGGEGRVEIEEVLGESLVEDIKSGALLEYLRNNPDDGVGSFEDLVRQNKVPQEVLDVIATILSHSSAL